MQDRGNTGKPSPQQRYRESAEERGLAAAARLAAAVAAATSHHPAPAVQAHASAENFRLRRHSTGCRTAPGQPTPSVRQAWTDDRQDAKERPREGPQSEMRARETRQPRVAPGEVAPRVDTSPLRPRLARAQSARRPTRPSAPARARSADPRRRQEGAFGGFVPERREASRNKKASTHRPSELCSHVRKQIRRSWRQDVSAPMDQCLSVARTRTLRRQRSQGQPVRGQEFDKNMAWPLRVGAAAPQRAADS